MEHHFTLQSLPFQKIKEGTKIIESRLYDKKRQLLQVEDTILFHEQESGEICYCRVIGLFIFPSFTELMSAFPGNFFGWETQKEALEEISKYYEEEDVKKNGVIGIRIEVLRKDKRDF